MLIVSGSTVDLKTRRNSFSVLITGSLEMHNKCQKKVIFHQEIPVEGSAGSNLSTTITVYTHA